ncbi:MAG: amino acid adenylation domain-containing protein, partial [Ferruginibacter sp.]
QVIKTPQAIAVIFEEKEISFLYINELSNQLAHYLLSKGVKQDTLVPVCLKPSVEMIVGILGILKAGAAYVPIDPDYPAERISFMLQDSSAKMVLCNEASKSNLAAIDGLDIIELDEPLAPFTTAPVVNLQKNILAGQLAYVIYTSGSTGQPKGVMIEHGNLINYLVNNKTHYIAGKEGGTGSFIHLSFTFDASLTAIFMPLLAGKSIVIGSKKSINVFEDSNLQKYAPYDFIKITPSHLELLETTIGTNKEWLTQKLVIGGEALHLAMFSHFIVEQLNINVINEYGPTEATVGCSTYCFNILHDNEKLRNGISIGKPIDNAQMYILDEDSRLLPVGVTGEICVGGNGIARGYLNRPALTAEKFVKDPFSESKEARIYKTGDLGRWLPDGNIEYLGRKDDQVKIRGYRVEPGEIEAVLQQCELVKQAVVLAREDNEGNNRLIAYVITEDDFDKEAIIAYLHEKLPEYMVPGLWVSLKSIPLTSNGKVDRKALPDPVSTDLATNEFVAPRTETEKKLAAVWKELLDIDELGIHDDFFDLGGHSLLAIRLISAIRKQLKVELAINDVFDYPTIALLSAHMQMQSGTSVLPAIGIQTRPQHIPLSFSQERLWFIDQLEG